MFNRFLSRMRQAHPIFGEKKILIVILEFLEGQELFQMYQVCYSFRNAIQSVSILEITMLKYTIAQSNNYIEAMKGKNIQTNDNFSKKKLGFGSIFLYSYFKKKEGLKGEKTEIKEEKNFGDEKWQNFKNEFHTYARNNGLKILKREDFDDERQWKDYRLKYFVYYHNYIDHIRQQRFNQERLTHIKRRLYFKYKNIVENLNYNFHIFTNFRFYKQPSDPVLVPKKK